MNVARECNFVGAADRVVCVTAKLEATKTAENADSLVLEFKEDGNQVNLDLSLIVHSLYNYRP